MVNQLAVHPNLIPVPMWLVDKGDKGALCGRPVQQDYYGDGEFIYWQRCEEVIQWDQHEDGVIWCLSGHEYDVSP